ncbi:heparan-alpha-glucosaminide N-acetyltransferase domain-containing protein [Massilia sp. W12]|uniref:acyltransferase family protein n=1 Tax=Massilia sp. W12 TaxID=3126507 RepID=UPI0030D25A2F
MQGERNLALDVLRGLTVACMIVVNTPGSWSHVYAPLLHADWHGFSPTDLVFPAFVFVLGNALALSWGRLQALAPAVFWRKTLRRSLLLFTLGVVLHWIPFYRFGPDGAMVWIGLERVRLPGVLQRIALCYLLCSAALYLLGWRRSLLLAGAGLAAHSALLLTWGDMSLQHNPARALDLWLLGPQHLYQGEGLPFDPEGLLGVLSSCTNLLAGFYAGQILAGGPGGARKLWIAVLGLTLAGLLIAPWLPLNKKLWSASYALFSSGLCCALLAALHGMLGRPQAQAQAQAHSLPMRACLALGRNALAMYVLGEALVILLISFKINGQVAYDYLFAAVYAPLFGALDMRFASLMYAFSALGLCVLSAHFLARRGWYLRL